MWIWTTENHRPCGWPKFVGTVVVGTAAVRIVVAPVFLNVSLIFCHNVCGTGTMTKQYCWVWKNCESWLIQVHDMNWFSNIELSWTMHRNDCPCWCSSQLRGSRRSVRVRHEVMRPYRVSRYGPSSIGIGYHSQWKYHAVPNTGKYWEQYSVPQYQYPSNPKDRANCNHLIISAF